MKRLALIVLFLLFIATPAFPAANQETGDHTAIPVSLYGKDDDSVLRALNTNTSGGITIADPDLDIADGGVTGLVSVNKFGRAPDGVQATAAELAGFLKKHTIGIQSTGASHFSHPFLPYAKFEGPCIIKIQGIASAADVEGSAGFDLILKDN